MTRQLAINLGACALLLVQYLLGMVVNVYVVLPGRTSAPVPVTTSPVRSPGWPG